MEDAFQRLRAIHGHFVAVHLEGGTMKSGAKHSNKQHSKKSVRLMITQSNTFPYC